LKNNQTGSVLELFISIKGHPERFGKESITLDESGVIDDKYYAKNSERSILITSTDSYRLARENGIEASYSSLGENILIDINPYGMVPGDRLKIGSAILEITQNCTICNSLSKVDDRLPKILESSRGIFAKAVNDAVVRKGDKVDILK
jgi:MOSC domain-containing protein YiiM